VRVYVLGVHRETARGPESVSILGIISAKCKYLLCGHYYRLLHEIVYFAERMRILSLSKQQCIHARAKQSGAFFPMILIGRSF